MKTKSRTSLVLMELIITILFFSLCSAVCVQFFVNAHLTSKKAQELNRAVSKAQGFAEALRGTDGTFESVVSLYPEAVINSDNSFTVYYDENFNPTDSKENAVYYSDVTFDITGNIVNIDIVLDLLDSLNHTQNTDDTNDSEYGKETEPIYTLSVTKYLRQK